MPSNSRSPIVIGMTGIVVLFELDQAAQAEGPVGEEPAVLLVHAAGQDPDVPEGPLPRTFCGEDTGPWSTRITGLRGQATPGTRFISATGAVRRARTF